MATVRVAQAASRIIVLGEEKRGEGAVRGVLAKKLVHRTQQALRLIHGDSALAAQIGLEIGHQQCSGNSFTGYVANHETEPLAPQV